MKGIVLVTILFAVLAAVSETQAQSNLLFLRCEYVKYYIN
jgi:hypothetical protein